jgi:ATP-dependent DNA helicase RecG
MRSKASHIVETDSSLAILSKTKTIPAHLNSLVAAGIKTIDDLFWILPLRSQPMPKARPYSEAVNGELFLGKGKIIHREIKPAFGRKSKNRFLLHNGYIIVKDLENDATLPLRFFNLWPQQKKQLEDFQEIWFLGQMQEWRAQYQIINPKFHNLIDADWINQQGQWLVEYPTINKVPGNYTQKLFDKLPSEIWNSIKSPYETDDLCELKLSEAFKTLHCKIPVSDFSLQKKELAIERLAYEEFFIDQLKIATRRKFIKQKKSPIISSNQTTKEKIQKSLLFQLTADQNKALDQIFEDLTLGNPMMRMLQGDVGCGKTIVAMIVALTCIEQGYQIVIMCPTEALAQQHFQTALQLFNEYDFFKPTLVLGSTKKKEKDSIRLQISKGEFNFVIGTHALFQESIVFSKLGLAIIDEQHKFGVEQRLSLTAKGVGVHCLIMSATPIPRTLSLAQYGDLDFTTIKTMPEGRKATKTRIVENQNYPKYIDFIHQRLKLGDQGYFVFPAIEESESMTLQNVTEALEKYNETFKGHKLAALHGKMKAPEKEKVIQDFTQGKIDILISTSVIEVGINIPNATFMCVYDPERFGLSSLHQLRGRVGRAEKAGYCFLVPKNSLSPQAMDRLSIMEKTNNGFEIAEADLQNRGEGDLFGVDQSGVVTRRRVADFMKHSKVLEKVYKDIRDLIENNPKKIDPILLKLAHDQKILDTI